MNTDKGTSKPSRRLAITLPMRPIPAMPICARAATPRAGKPVRLPIARAHIAVRLGKAADRRQRQPHGEIRHLIVQHVGRVGHDDAPLGRGRDIDGIITNPEIADDLQIRQTRHQRVRGGNFAAGNKADNLIAMVGDDLIQPQHIIAIQIVARGQGLIDALVHLADAENFNAIAHELFKAPIARGFRLA